MFNKIPSNKSRTKIKVHRKQPWSRAFA